MVLGINPNRHITGSVVPNGIGADLATTSSSRIADLQYCLCFSRPSRLSREKVIQKSQGVFLGLGETAGMATSSGHFSSVHGYSSLDDVM